ncbi:MAG: complex I NDUFA9 subunit family protein [Ottowia sp.]|nr:complex I NDUFA9 subunit family protein [Ottowia sp.]
MATRILVLGGSGFVGRHLMERLQRLDHLGVTVTVPTRRIASARELWTLTSVQAVEADVMQDGVLEQLLPGHDAVVNLVGRLHGKHAEFDALHVQLPRRLAAACAASGVKRLIHVSALAAAGSAPSHYLRSKAAGEQVLLQAAQLHQLQLTLLRPGIVFGPGGGFLNLFASVQRMLPVVPLAHGSARFQPVFVRDVALAIVRCLQDKSTAGQTYELCGPDVWTLRELMRAAGQWAGIRRGRGRPVWPIPATLGRVQAWLLERMPGTPMLSRDNLDSMKLPSVASGRLPGLQELGVTPTPLAAAGPISLGRKGFVGRLDSYRSEARR